MRVGLAARYAAFVTSHPLRAVGKFLRVGARNLLHWIGSPALAPCRSYLDSRCAPGRSNRARIATCESFPRLLQRLDAVRQLQLGDALGDVAQLDAPQLAVAAVGSSSRRSSNRFAANSVVKKPMPVRLPPRPA